MSKVFLSTKTYTHSVGLSCAFRQWRATSHCNKLHGYALEVKVQFIADTLDDRNWVMDFGGLKDLKKYLEYSFDHKTLIAGDDPELALFMQLDDAEVIDLVIVEDVGCERFAEQIFDWITEWLNDCGDTRVSVYEVEVREHAGNSAIVRNKADE